MTGSGSVKRIWMSLLVLAIAIASWASTSAKAQEARPVDLQLILAVDVSSSVDQQEFALQMRGIAAGFRHPDVIDAIESTGGLGIAVTLIQWSDKDDQVLAVDWTHVYDEASAAEFARRVRRTPRGLVGGQTAISGALQYSMWQFERSPYESWRRVVDISGDGRANAGVHPMQLRDRAIDEGVVINGLAILNEEPFVDHYFQESVVGGYGAFVLTADDYEDFAASMLDKLIREIAAPLAEAPAVPPLRVVDSGE